MGGRGPKRSFFVLFGSGFRGVRNCLLRVFNGEFRVLWIIVENIVKVLLTATVFMDFMERVS